VYNLDDNINSFLYGGEKGKHVYKFDWMKLVSNIRESPRI
jgi:hypothetical protein